MQTLPFDFTADETRTGFRLHRVEVLNWGNIYPAGLDHQPGRP